MKSPPDLNRNLLPCQGSRVSGKTSLIEQTSEFTGANIAAAGDWPTSEVSGEASMSTAVLTEGMTGALPRPSARITGVVYLLYFLTAVSAEVFVGRSRLVAYDAVNLIAHAFYIAVTLLFYSMFKPVSRSLSLLAALFSLLGCAKDVLDLFHLDPYKISTVVFFGPYCLLIGYLIFKSTFLPRILGVLMALAGLGWLIFLSPLVHYLSTYLKILGFVAEASLMLWLVVKGVNVQRWKEQASAAGQRRFAAHRP
jgi:hypothetical protein